jgi:hypothetical protein
MCSIYLPILRTTTTKEKGLMDEMEIICADCGELLGKVTVGIGGTLYVFPCKQCVKKEAQRTEKTYETTQPTKVGYKLAE